MPLDLKSDSTEAKEPRRFTISLSTAGLVGSIGLLLVGLAWVFIIGVLVGRGYKPERAVPELARIMPNANATSRDAPPREGVLRAEDLQFYDDLSKKPGTRAKPSAKAQIEPKAAPAPEPKTATTPAPKAAPKAAAPAAPEPAPKAAAITDDDSDQTVYDYRYQVASVQDQASAQAFQKRLAGLGIDSSLEQAQVGGKTWMRIMAHFRGRPQDTRDLKAKLATLGVDKPIMRSKQHVGEAAPQ